MLPTSFSEGERHVENESYAHAVKVTIFSVSIACLFGCGMVYFRGEQLGLEFFTGYVVEQSLSIDNLFVVPLQYQSRVLTWGIIGAVLMRGVMIFIGVAAIKHFQVIILVFAAILIVSAIKLLRESGGDEEEDLENNFILKISKWVMKSTNEYDVDSIPAVLGVSQDLFVVYSSNVFAILGLRSLYVLVAKAVNDLPYLRPAVALVLGFVGSKMVGEYFHHDLSTVFSLSVIILLLLGGVGMSYFAKSGYYIYIRSLLVGTKADRLHE